MPRQSNLYINEFKRKFKDYPVITTDDIMQFYNVHSFKINKNTLKSRIYYLIVKSVMQRIGKGKYTLGKVEKYMPFLRKEMITIFSLLKNRFPYASFCVLDTHWFNEFMIHQPVIFQIIIESESDVSESIFNFFKENDHNVFLNPKKDILNNYVIGNDACIIVKNMVSESPVFNVDNVVIPTIEKMLVDLVADNDLYGTQQGAELLNIFNEVFEKYTIDQNKLFRYSRRRNKEIQVKKLMPTLF